MMARFSAVALALVLSFTFACGDSETVNNGSPNVATNNTTANNTSTNNPTPNNAGENNQFSFCELTDGSAWTDRYQMRFDSLAFKPMTPGAGLNGLLADGINNQEQEFPIVVLLDVRDLDTAAGSFELRGGSGLKTDTAEEYEWEPEADDTYFDGLFDPDCGAFTATVDLFEFVATFETESGPEKVILPINQLEFDAAIKRDGGTASIEQGELTGYITKEQADATLITLTPGSSGIPLTTVLNASQLDYNTATGELVPDGEGDAWRLAATFSAIETTIID
jgi:hypothetical protein